MKYRLALFLVVLVLTSSLAFAQEVTLDFTSPNNQDFANYIITVNINGESTRDVLSSSSYKIEINGEQEIEVILNSFSSPTPDYYGKREISESSSFSVFPIGYLQGRVFDAEENLIPDADLHFNCFAAENIEFPVKADSTGFFVVPNIPIGRCTIRASDSGEVGKSEITIEQGKIANVDIYLSNRVGGAFAYWYLFALGLLVAAALIWWALHTKSKKSAKPKQRMEEPNQDTKESSTKQTDAIMKTLSVKERKVIEYLLENNNKTSQAKIRHATGIPRTSLSRLLMGLEGKKLVSIERHGKMVSISLTDLFLGKE